MSTVWSPPFRKGGGNEITKNQKGGLSDSVAKKGVWVKRVEQGWGLDPTPNTGEKWELAEKDTTHNVPHNFIKELFA